MAYRNYSGGASIGYGMTPWVKRLLIANLVVYLAGLALPVGAWMALVPSELWWRPWTVVTYMFVHGGFLHFFFNMIILFFFGPPLEGLWGGREFLKFYAVSGLAAAAFSFIFAYDAAVIGASGALYGIMLAFAMNWPDMPIHIWGILPIKAKWLVTILAAASILSLAGGAQDGVAHFAHLGGFVGGFLYLKTGDRLNGRISRLQEMVRRRKLSVTTGSQRSDGDPAGPSRRSPRSQRQEDRMLDEVDRVLDKISESGLQSLSAEEIELLDRVSKKYRQN